MWCAGNIKAIFPLLPVTPKVISTLFCLNGLRSTLFSCDMMIEAVSCHLYFMSRQTSAILESVKYLSFFAILSTKILKWAAQSESFPNQSRTQEVWWAGLENNKEGHELYRMGHQRADSCDGCSEERALHHILFSRKASQRALNHVLSATVASKTSLF